jgi:hypothetical protein
MTSLWLLIPTALLAAIAWMAEKMGLYFLSVTSAGVAFCLLLWACVQELAF